MPDDDRNPRCRKYASSRPWWTGGPWRDRAAESGGLVGRGAFLLHKVTEAHGQVQHEHALMVGAPEGVRLYPESRLLSS